MDSHLQSDEQHRHGSDFNAQSIDDNISNSSTDKLLGRTQEQTRPSKDYGSIDEKRSSPGNHEKSLDPATQSSIPKYPFFMLNVLVTLLSASGSFHSPLMDQYLYQRFADSVLGNSSVKTPRHPCLNESGSNGTSELVNKVQSMTSQLTLYLDLTSYGLGIVGCILLGLFSATLSRKTMLLIPTMGYMIKCVMIPVVVYWNLNIYWFFLGYIAEGLTGTTSGVLLGVFLYTSDITSRDRKRTFAVVIIEGSKGIMTAGLSVVTGKLLGKSGFVLPAFLSMGCVVLGVIVVLLLPNRKPMIHHSQSEGKFSVSEWRKTLVSPFSKSYSKRVRTMITTGCAAFLICLLSMSGIAKVRNLYLMNLPFCWSSMEIGWYLFGREVSHNLFTMLSIPLLYRFLPGMGLGILGGVSAIAGYTMLAVAKTDLELILVPVLGIGHMIPIGLIRGETSRLFGPEAQGPLFAYMAVLESISFTMGTPALLLYRASLSFFRGLVIVVFGALMLVVLVLLVIYQVTWRRHISELTNKEQTIQPIGSINF